MTTGMTGAKLRFGELKDFRPLATQTDHVYKFAEQIRHLVETESGADIADMLAKPVLNDQGNIFDWYAPFKGEVVPWAKASAESKAKVLPKIRDFRETLAKLSDKYSDDHKRKLSLRCALQIPSEDHIYLVNGKPVFTFWGFVPNGASLEHNVLEKLDPESKVPDTSENSEVSIDVPKPRWKFPWRKLPWWLWLLILIPLLLWGLSMCSPSLPSLGMGSDRSSGTSKDGGSFRLPDFNLPGFGLPGFKLPGFGSPGLGGGVPDVSPTDSGPSNATESAVTSTPSPSPVPQKPALTTSQPPASTPSPSPMPQKPTLTTSPPPVSMQPPAIPSQTQKLPNTVLQSGDIGSLDGHWRSLTGLMENRTGKPIIVEYDFNGGRGTATINRSDGISCRGPANATIKDQSLVVSQQGNLVCSDGSAFAPSNVSCVMGKNQDARCQGQYPDGERYDVEIVR